MKRFAIVFFSFFVAIHFVPVRIILAEGLTPQEEFFENEVRPLLVEKCQRCHDGNLQESDLRLDSRAFVLQGGISGPAAIAKNIDDSAIMKAVLGKDDFERMPPDERLSADQIKVLRRWIQMGLPWPSSDQPLEASLGDQVVINQIAKKHWAFQKITHPVPPKLDAKRELWAANPIDVFIAKSLSDKELTPSPPAQRRDLVRRLYFDLIGLQPTADEVEKFVSNSNPTRQVVAKTIDQLLSSEHHGERWARYWLDLARYADTSDWQAQAEIRFPYAYTYRDYVIESFNTDKPYDQFLREQIAADFYTSDETAPELAALGLMTVGPRFRNDRLERGADQIDVVCRGLMGITVSCARCHDHKYDPIPIEDFYSLYGVFASTTEPESYPTIAGHATSPDQADFEKQLAEKQKALEDYKEKLRTDAIKSLTQQLPQYISGFVMMTVEGRASIRGVIDKLEVEEIAMTPLNNNLAKHLKLPSATNDTVFGPWAEGLNLSESDYKKQSARFLEKWRNDKELNQLVKAQLENDQPKTRSELAKSYGVVFHEAIKKWQANSTSTPLDDPALEAIRTRLFDAGGWFDLDTDAVVAASRLLGKGRKILGDFEKAITEVEVTHPGAPPRAMTLVDIEKPVTPFVYLRGEVTRKGDRVPRQFLRILSGEDRVPFRDGSGRRELAEAVASEENPLTARVLVNRVWARYFGRGLVDSLDDFGLRSPPPSHPELLDWLASEFMQNGWSLKWLHRTITTSSTYAQSSQNNPVAAQLDPENRLLWRQNRRRLDFEAMRDSMLAVSGVLNREIGGRSVALSDEPYSYRRSLYAYIDRNELDPILRTFDFASPTASAASRSETTVPQQALFSMNHPFVADLARAIAKDIEAHLNAESQIKSVYRKVYSRDPSPQETSIATRFLEDSRDTPPLNLSVWQYGHGPVATDPANPIFQPLVFWDGSAYQMSAEFPDPVFKFLRIGDTTVHPGKSNGEGAIRRWIAPTDGTVQIHGTVKHTRPNGDGIIATIRSGGFTQSAEVFNREEKTMVPKLDMKSGQAIDFISSPGATPTADAHSWTVVITGVTGSLKGLSWNSRDEFVGPPPPPLSPLAQLAQALFLTNEFLYLD